MSSSRPRGGIPVHSATRASPSGSRPRRASASSAAPISGPFRTRSAAQWRSCSPPRAALSPASRSISGPSRPPRIFLRTARVARVLGVERPVPALEQCLVAIGATVVSKPAEGRLAVDVPGWRPDLREEIDLVEEIARIHGYDALPDTLRPFRPGNQTDAPIAVAADQVRTGLVAEGLYEVILLPVGPPDATDAVPILNPLPAEHGPLRGRLLPGLLRQVEANWASQVRDVRLFEVGTVFAGTPDGRPDEETHVGAAIRSARED